MRRELFRTNLWKLDGKKPVPCKTTAEWFAWVTKGFPVQVAHDLIGKTGHVSTIFLGVAMGPRRPPLLFETMVFRRGKSIDQMRSATWAAALKAHREMLEKHGD